MSLYTYSYLAGAIDRIAQVPEPAGARRALPALQGGDVLVGGVIGPQGFDLQAGFFRRPLPADVELPPDDGPYAVELHNRRARFCCAVPLRRERPPTRPIPKQGTSR